MEIENKVALITGGASGLGLAITKELLSNKIGHVAIVDLGESKGDQIVRKLNAEFGPNRAIFIICDVTKPHEFEDAFKKTVAEFGGLDIVINNAGMMEEKKWNLMVNVNFNAVVNGTLLGFQYMGQNHGLKGGVVLNVASVTGLYASPATPIYAGTKHAVVGFSRSVGVPNYYETTGVRVLVICPGLTETPLIGGMDERALNIISSEEVKGFIALYHLQTSDNVGRGAVSIIRSGKPGSVWICEAGKPTYQVQFPDNFDTGI